MKDNKTISGNLFDLKILNRLFQYLKPYKRAFFFLIFLTVTSAFLGPAKPLIIKYTLDNYILTKNAVGLRNMVLLLLGLLAVHSIVEYLHTYIASWLGQTVIKDIRIRLFSHLINFRLKFFDRTPIGTLVTRNVSDIETLSNVFSEGLASIVADLLQLATILGVMFYINWKLTLYSLSMLPLLLLSTYVFKEKIKSSFNEVRTAVARLNAFVQEHITGMNIVQIFNSEDREYEKFRKINEEHKISNLKSVLYYSIYMPVAEIMAAIGTGLLIWYGANAVIKESVSLGDLVAFIMYIAMFFRPIRMIADRFNTLQMGIVSSDRIFNLLDNKDDIIPSGTYKAQSFRGEVSFQNVWFAYSEEDYVLKNISFDVKTGEKVALVGATGAGKSSIINILNRFYDINKGTILVDGVELKTYDLDYLRSQIAIVLQDVFLFSDSIRNNITLRNDAISDAKIWEAAELVGARSFIERLPGGLNYNVQERGATLSVGQRQLISFIRAMVYDPKIIVLDEATSSIDSETEELIQKAIEKLMMGRTSIVIAHRLSTIKNSDKIIVMEKGEIKETGKHDELIAQDGLYAQLNKLQYKNLLEA